jgi:RNA polymerase sigma-70 factor (ECF subfamily)
MSALARFIAALPAPVDDEPALAAGLAGFLAEARRAGLAVDDGDLAAHVAERLGDEAELPAALEALFPADLALAFACLRGDRAAVARLVQEPLAEVLAELRRSRPDLADDVGQRVLELLLVGGPDRVPKLGQYTGRAALKSWLRVIATRLLVREAGKLDREEADEDRILLERAVDGGAPELAYLKASLRPVFVAAFTAAIAGLSLHDRLLLRQHFVDQLGIDQIGALHGVHRATAARWLARIRDRLLADTERRLQGELGPGELAEVWPLIASQIDLSVRRLLSSRSDP